jgi:DNA-3-methyladenine glycosylase
MSIHNWPDLDADAPTAAKRLLGALFVRTVHNQQLIGKIVETEAYDETDAASHSYRGKTPRTEIMFGPSGYLYVYFTYGMHYCCNVVCGPVGRGSAVLIRGIEPILGLERMSENRRQNDILSFTNGPAKLCQALEIDKSLNGHDLTRVPLILKLQSPVSIDEIVDATRVGITQAREKPWRFYLKSSKFVSKK